MASEVGLPRATFAKLAPHPYLLANLDSQTPGGPLRSNGRAPDAGRSPYINQSSLTHAHGSALVRLGNTTVICGVRGETIPVSKIPSFRESNTETELLDYDLLVPNIELATGCSPQFLPGVPPTTLAQTLSTRAFSLLHSSKLVKPEDLRIRYSLPNVAAESDDSNGDKMVDEEQEQNGEAVTIAYWVLYIDLYFISFDGNPFDASWAAIVAALKDTKLPKAQWDADREMVLCSRSESLPLTITSLPVACTATVFNNKDLGTAGKGKYWLLLDPDSLEEKLCSESITMVVDKTSCKTKILGITKAGGTTISPELLSAYVEVSEKRWDEFKAVLS
ncbi:Exosome complex component rrp43 [Ceratocystis lukuohia]|uniref:Ribosomal RNA-processing protein 43 n=1 Tax=Ceratocystis lukuohia TaxID=2019550 RepID=A0ABR4MRV2_9PEZI